MPTVNEELFDASVRHQVAVRRFTSGETRRVLALLEATDRDLVRLLRERLQRLGPVQDFQSTRLKALLQDVRAARVAAMTSLREVITGDLLDLAKTEAAVEIRLLKAAVPIQIEFATVQAQVLREIVYRRPFQGQLLGGWYKGLQAADQRRLTDALQLGLAQGESVPQIMARVAGTKANQFTDGALSITRRNAETVVRTAANHVSNAARETVWEENADVIAGLRWTSTLDGRTSPICRGADGQVVMMGDRSVPKGMIALDPPGQRPPAHPGCRSLMVAFIDGEGLLGTRPSVTDTRRRAEREIDFRKQARQEGVPIQEVRARWAAENVGSVPAATTYQEWLTKQSASFQDDVLGKGKAELFRKGDVTLDQFVDRRGNELSLEQLQGKV